MTPRSPTVVTGLGSVDASGAGRESLAAAFADGAPRLAVVDRTAAYHRTGSARLAALVGELDLDRWVSAREARRMSPPSKMTVAAARMALADAGLDDAGLDAAADPDPATAIFLATTYGPASFTEKILRQIRDEGPEAVSPFYFTESVANAPAAQVALATRALGANVTFTQREAGPLLALARGAEEVASGRARRALVGTVDEMPPVLHAILDRFGALSSGGRRGYGAGGGEVARPFDRCRDGVLAAEGAAMVVVESGADAAARGARPLARVVAAIGAFDPQATAAGWGRDPAVLAGSLGRRLAAAGVAVESIDRIVSGAAGSRQGDRLEALVLRRVWGERRLPPILVPKALTGEHGGGLLAGGVLAAAGATFGPTPGFSEVDPELDVAPYRGERLPPPRRVLVTALAAGGSAAWAVLDRGAP